MTPGGSSYIELPIKFLSILNIQKKIDRKCGIWCITVHLHPVETNASWTKGCEKVFGTIITIGINLGMD